MSVGLLTAFALGLPAAAQAQEKSQSQPAAANGRVAAGQKQKVSGVIVSREADNMVVRDAAGAVSHREPDERNENDRAQR